MGVASFLIGEASFFGVEGGSFLGLTGLGGSFTGLVSSDSSSASFSSSASSGA